MANLKPNYFLSISGFSISPGLSTSVCDLAGGSFGAGAAAGIGLAGASGQVTFGEAGPTFSGSLQFTGVGAGVAAYGTYSNTNVNLISQGNLGSSLQSWLGL